MSDEAGQVLLTINGEQRSFTVESRTLLVQLLRNDCGLTGAKIGCDTGQCGACTVLVDGRAMKSCMLLAIRLGGASITSIEGLASAGEVSSLQRSFIEHHGLQCGFCTPGMILAAADLLSQDSRPDEDAIRHALAGNLCRCTGYQSIVESVQAAASETVLS
jgi:carbon-monoxide dehydrogenase small subunit